MGGAIKELKQKIEKLEQENLCLRQILDEAGISYNEKLSLLVVEPDREEVYDANQGAGIEPIEITDKNANNFFVLFCRGR